VLREISRCSGTQFDPDLVPAFLSLHFDRFDDLITEHRVRGLNTGGIKGSAA
jgi:hypothetical protein